jgi:regulator of replication initiation timing
MKPSDRIPNATEIPPHVKELGLLKDALHTCGETLQTLNKMIPDMKECIKESIEEAAEHFAQSNGHVTSSRLEEMFETFESKTLKEIKTVTQQTQRTQAANVNRLPTQAFGFQNLLFGTYEHNDRADWQVPQDFTFPASTQRRAGWDLWLKGDPSHRSRIRGEWRDTPVRPHRLMDPKHLPPKVRNVFKRSWRPIFQLMEEAPQVSTPRDPSSLDAPKINQLCDRGTQHLKSIVSYIWPDGDDNEQLNARREKWSVAT